ncbi:MAG: dodecin family protein [Alphaproteobacteria bacterium]
MSVLKIIEIMGESPDSWEAATAEAVEEAAKSVNGIQSVWIQDQSATVSDGRIDRYRVTCKITFEVRSKG